MQGQPSSFTCVCDKCVLPIIFYAHNTCLGDKGRMAGLSFYLLPFTLMTQSEGIATESQKSVLRTSTVNADGGSLSVDVL